MLKVGTWHAFTRQGRLNWAELRYPLAFGTLAVIGLAGNVMLWLQIKY